ncbi:MAG TPA: putative toxin-antitoxin system toxin component, PIN family [Thermoanaerobaculia bacterium]|nr:putative toxin-antitoxin system toxin component, PIN family [Thermoanaerobaculia bacterium]
MRIVLDTNVLVSGLLSPHGPPGRIVDLLLGGKLTLVFDDRLLAEYRAVLKRPRFGFDSEEVDAVLDYLESEGELIVTAPLGAELPDPGDLPFLEVAAQGEVDALVTGNLKHYPASQRGSVRVDRPADFLRRFH